MLDLIYLLIWIVTICVLGYVVAYSRVLANVLHPFRYMWRRYFPTLFTVTIAFAIFHTGQMQELLSQIYATDNILADVTKDRRERYFNVLSAYVFNKNSLAILTLTIALGSWGSFIAWRTAEELDDSRNPFGVLAICWIGATAIPPIVLLSVSTHASSSSFVGPIIWTLLFWATLVGTACLLGFVAMMPLCYINWISLYEPFESFRLLVEELCKTISFNIQGIQNSPLFSPFYDLVRSNVAPAFWFICGGAVVVAYGLAIASSISVVLFITEPLGLLLGRISFLSSFGWLNSPIIIVCMFLTAGLVIFYCSSLMPARIGLSPVGFALVIAITLAWFDLNDNHRLGTHGGQVDKYDVSVAETNGKPRELDAEFRRWLGSRSDRKSYGEKYPVYIVAAQGGGIYAAHHAAMFLATVQDHNPEFAQHLFAISAVSGGSMGAALFVALVGQGESALRDKASKFLAADFLSETLAIALFADLAARAIPCLNVFCPSASFSRGRGLELSLAKAWSKAGQSGGANPFVRSVTAHWQAQRGHTPALLLNTTEVETGERIVIAPFRFGAPDFVSLLERNAGLDVSLGTAVSLSARFPFLSPAGAYFVPAKKDEMHKRRLVDGGYFENSGVATALDVIRILEPEFRDSVRFIVIALQDVRRVAANPGAGSGLSETLTPLRTLDSVRSARGRQAVLRAHLRLDDNACDPSKSEPKNCATTGSMRVHAIPIKELDLPFGWALAKTSREAIRKVIGEPKYCTDAVSEQTSSEQASSERSRVIRRTRIANSCLISQISADLEAH